MTPPNVVLLTIDCLRSDHLGCYGYSRNTSPTIDELAEVGIKWENCYSTGPRTNESFPGIISSALSNDCGFFGETWHRTPPTPTLASWLSNRGYHTVARIANPQLARQKGYNYGFDTFKNLATGAVSWGVDEDEPSDEETESAFISNLGERIHDIRTNIREAGTLRRWGVYAPLFVAYREYQRNSQWPIVSGTRVAGELLEYMQEETSSSQGDTPAFYWSHFNDPHAPIHPDRVSASGLDNISRIRQYFADIQRIAQEQSNRYRRMYDSTIRYVDNQIKRIVEELQSSGAWENTVLILTADHGEALNDRGVYGHASGKDRYTYESDRDYLYNELIQVPLIVSGGAIADRKSVSEPMSTAWIHELISELTAVSEGEFVRNSGRESHITPKQPATVLADALTPKGHSLSVIRGEMKLMTKALQRDDSVTDGIRAFDLEKDPNERSPKQIKESQAKMIAIIEEEVSAIDELPEMSPQSNVDRETKNLLAQLGYA